MLTDPNILNTISISCTRFSLKAWNSRYFPVIIYLNYKEQSMQYYSSKMALTSLLNVYPNLNKLKNGCKYFIKVDPWLGDLRRRFSSHLLTSGQRARSKYGKCNIMTDCCQPEAGTINSYYIYGYLIKCISSNNLLLYPFCCKNY